MNKYKVNFVYSEQNNINDILIKVLKKELKNYMQLIYNNNIRKGE